MALLEKGTGQGRQDMGTHTLEVRRWCICQTPPSGNFPQEMSPNEICRLPSCLARSATLSASSFIEGRANFARHVIGCVYSSNEGSKYVGRRGEQ